MGDEAGGMASARRRVASGRAAKAGRCLPSGSSKAQIPLPTPHDQQAGHHSLGQRGQVVRPRQS